MEKKQWVQHISGQGEKWELSDHPDNDCKAFSIWRVNTKVTGNWGPVLPKSEYRLCDPPEVWRDVTADMTETGICHGIIVLNQYAANSGYRLRKVQLETPHKCGKTLASIVWAFIVEKKVS